MDNQLFLYESNDINVSVEWNKNIVKLGIKSKWTDNDFIYVNIPKKDIYRLIRMLGKSVDMGKKELK